MLGPVMLALFVTRSRQICMGNLRQISRTSDSFRCMVSPQIDGINTGFSTGSGLTL